MVSKSNFFSDYARGDPQAVSLVDKWARGAVGIFSRLPGQQNDVVQNVHLALLEGIASGRFRNKCSHKTYVMGVAKRQALNAQRAKGADEKRVRQPIYEGELEDHFVVEMDSKVRDRVNSLIVDLPEWDQSVLVSVLEGSTYEETARNLGISTKTVGRVLRGLKK